MSLAPGTRLGPYEVLAAIGAGGMGEVFRARDSKLGRDVALKVLPDAFAADAERMARFQREAKMLASLNHPNIASIYGFEDTTGAHALVMELVDGPTLADRIAGGAIPLDEALPIARQIAEGLEYAHERGIVHRDLKPANVKVTPDGAVKLLDFGLAKALEGETPTSDIANSPTVSRLATQAGVILGTVAYMSPEQAKGKSVDRRADIWAFGCVLFEMLVGHPAFDGDTVTDVLAAVVRAEPDWARLPAAAPHGMRELVQRCLAKDLRRRVQAIGDARIALEDLLSGTAAEPDMRAGAPPPRSRRELVAWTLCALAVLAVIAVGAWAWRQPRGAAPAPAALVYIPPPPGTSFRDFGFGAGPVVVSPDGQQLAFSATDQNGITQIWVRPLASGSATALTGTEDGSLPFWSADSRSLGFFADRKLKTVSLTNGAAQVVTDADCAARGAWSEQGTILFSPQCGGPLVSIPAGGGTARTLVQPADSSTTLGDAAFLPGGRDFLYVSVDRSSSPSIRIASLDTGRSRLLLDHCDAPRFIRGHLLFIRAGKLLAQPFDPQSGQLSGEAVSLADAPDYSASENGVIAFQGGTPQARLEWVDRSGNVLGALGDVERWLAPRISPDGAQVVAVNDTDLWTFPATGGVGTRLTFGPGEKAFDAWSPDGRYIAYSCDAGGTPAVCRKPADGSGAEQTLLKLGSEALGSRVVDWSADGRYLSFDLESAKNRGWGAWVLPLEGHGKPFQPAPVTANQYDGLFSPDGHWYAYFSYETGRPEVFVVSFPEPGAKYQISQAGGWASRWAAGDKLFFLSMGNRMMEADVVASGKSLQVKSIEPLFSSSLPRTSAPLFDVTSNGTRFVVAASADPAAANSITLLLNWPALLNRP
jgi:eukaryotic-like serine/threonine-protein kinase